ncbi:POTE ankyrin domain family member B-like isoform X3 [Ochotona princeps]|uniref:POTE ankyrin domain family member B-like isoform X3 n=1 Tax=Ochotona princeps TaxID=9978 RepID=UPI0027154694|nr:POTE ankyrin domain family member B-like isoform X3 [Ochotona princeps]
MTQRLLKSQFEYHARDKKLGKIHRAASKGDVLTIHHLLEVQASGVNDRDRSNRTALHLACAKGHVEVVNFLIGRQCLIDAIDNADMTPLMKATQCNQEKCAIILLEHGADPNHTDRNGNTALHYAIYNENTGIAKQLIQHNADIKLRNKDDLTPLLVAICAKRENTVDFLVKNNDIFHALDNMDRFCNKFGHVDHLIAPGVEDFNLFTMKEPSTSSDVKNKNDTAGIQSAKKEQANKDGINCTDEFCNYTNAVSTLRVEEKIVESSSDSKSISQSPLQKNDDQAGTAEEREMCRNQPLTNSNKKEKAPWAMSKQSFHRSFRTSKHNTVVPELEHVSSPTHNDTELTIKKGQTLLERTECIQPQNRKEPSLQSSDKEPPGQKK